MSFSHDITEAMSSLGENGPMAMARRGLERMGETWGFAGTAALSPWSAQGWSGAFGTLPPAATDAMAAAMSASRQGLPLAGAALQAAFAPLILSQKFALAFWGLDKQPKSDAGAVEASVAKAMDAAALELPAGAHLHALPAPAEAEDVTRAEVSSPEPRRPEGLPAPIGGEADDLKVITGIGPKIERTLNDLGIYHFSQIATWSAPEAAWIERHLRSPGRVARGQWVDQAGALASGVVDT